MSTGIRYAARGEIERLAGGSKLRRPKPGRDRSGRITRDPGAHWDWYYQLDPSERAYISANHMGGTVGPDELGENLDAWLQAVRVARKREETYDPFSDDYMAAEAPEILEATSGDILGPQEIAALLGVQANTIHAWRKRDKKGNGPGLPEPFAIVSGVPLWVRPAILEWAELTGRSASA